MTVAAAPSKRDPPGAPGGIEVDRDLDVDPTGGDLDDRHVVADRHER